MHFEFCLMTCSRNMTNVNYCSRNCGGTNFEVRLEAPRVIPKHYSFMLEIDLFDFCGPIKIEESTILAPRSALEVAKRACHDWKVELLRSAKSIGKHNSLDVAGPHRKTKQAFQETDLTAHGRFGGAHRNINVFCKMRVAPKIRKYPTWKCQSDQCCPNIVFFGVIFKSFFSFSFSNRCENVVKNNQCSRYDDFQ